MAEILGHPYAALLARLSIGMVLLSSGLGKVFAREDTVRTVFAYNILPEPLAKVYGLLLPWTELGLAGLILVGLVTKLSALALCLLLLSFAIAVVVNLVRGVEMDCGCFGRPERLSWLTLVRILVLFALAIVIAAYDTGYLTLELFLTEGRLISAGHPSLSGFLPVLISFTLSYIGYELSVQTARVLGSHRQLRWVAGVLFLRVLCRPAVDLLSVRVLP